MQGSPAHQILILYTKSGIDAIGKSKHEAKVAARAAAAIGGASVAVTWHRLGKELGVHSYATQNAYRDVWRNTFKFAKENFQIKDIEKLAGEHVVAYLQSKIDQGVAHATFMLYAAALEKLEVALNKYSRAYTRGKEYNFSAAINSVRVVAHSQLEHFAGYRDYSAPQKIIDSLKNPTHKLVARLQLDAGLRIKETDMISKNQLLPNYQFRVEGGKGGKIRIVSLPADLYRQLQAIISANNGIFRYNKDTYRTAIKTAAKITNQEYHGTHGLRWNYAQSKFVSYQHQQKETYEQAEKHVSNDLGHDRADMTQHYLG